ncbi:MAG: aminotransferase class V-fold PLP-dependent enzyme [Nitriliruptoraceae bacterium]
MVTDRSHPGDASVWRSQFAPEGIFLNTPTYGLPPQQVVAAMTGGIERWQRGVGTTDEYDGAVARARALFADLVGVTPQDVAVANQVSVLVGTVAASLPDGCRVLTVEGDFTSLLYPLLAQQHRGVTVRTVALEELADAISDDIDMVAFSLVQSSDGRIADLDAILAAASRHFARTLVDATHAVGWLPVDATRVDYLVVGAYKWLLSPRGTAFLAIRPEHVATIQPIAPGWYAAEDVWGSIYDANMRLADSARRADVSPAWLCWLGTVPALELITAIKVKNINRHDVALANRVRDALDLAPSASAIVSIPTKGAVDLAAHGIKASVRAGTLRIGCHLYNNDADVDTLIEAVRPAVMKSF